MNNLTDDTKLAFSRIEQALLGNTEDNLKSLMSELNSLLNQAKQIEEVSSCIINGDC